MTVVGCVLALTGPAVRAQDSDRLRAYLNLRYGDLAVGLTNAHDGAGGSLGVNLNRHFGVELSLDSYDVKVGEVAELQVFEIVPQLRLRYPLLHDRLVPYAVGGAGLSVTQANDARAPVTWPGGKTDVHAAGTLGGGIEYFVADNVALGLDLRYLFSGTVAYRSADEGGDVETSTTMFSASVRIFYPELHAARDAAAAELATARFYLAVEGGGALLVNLQPFPGVHATAEQSLFGSNFTPLVGVAAGATIGRYAALELWFENYELKLSTDDLGGIGDYSVFPFTLLGKFRYPLGKRVELSVSAGPGAEMAQINDRTFAGNTIAVSARDITPIGRFGVGVEYGLMTNVTLGVGAHYIISRGHTIRIDDGPTESGNFDTFLLLLQLRAVLFDL